MHVSIDLGGSTVDLIIFDNSGAIEQKHSFESSEIDRSNLKSILGMAKITFKQIQKLRVTGGYSLHLPDEIEGMKLEKVTEFEANGFGGKFLAKKENCLVVSLGTGTSMVKVINGKIEHIGGTGVGGGTLVGLGKLLLNEIDHQTIDKLAIQGNLSQVDLSVKDIVGGGIGIIPGDATASNFGKAALNPLLIRSGDLKETIAKKDLALGICNLIGETVGSLAYFASQKYELDKIVLIGKVTRVKSIVDIIRNTSKIYDKEILIPENADFGTAIGAGLLEIKG